MLFLIKILHNTHKPSYIGEMEIPKLLKQLRLKSNTKTNSISMFLLLFSYDSTTIKQNISIPQSETQKCQRRKSKPPYLSKLTARANLILRLIILTQEKKFQILIHFPAIFTATKQRTKFVTYKQREKQLRSVQFRNIA